LASAGQVLERLEPAIRSAGDLHLDLRGLEFMDSSGIHALIKLCRGLEGRGHVVLHALTPQVAKVLELVRADTFPNLVVDGDGRAA
jgi:anti-anti-sigma factor